MFRILDLPGLAILGTNLSFSRPRYQILNECTPCIELVLDIRLLEAIVRPTLVQQSFDVDCVLSTFQERKSAEKDVRIKDFGDDAIDQAEDPVLIQQYVGAVVLIPFVFLWTVASSLGT